MTDGEHRQVARADAEWRIRPERQLRANQLQTKKAPKPYKVLNKRDRSFTENKSRDASFTRRRNPPQQSQPLRGAQAPRGKLQTLLTLRDKMNLRQMRTRLKPKVTKAKQVVMPKLQGAQPASTGARAMDLPRTTSDHRRSKENKMSQSNIQE